MSVADFLPYLAAGIARTMLEQLRTALPLPIPDTPENRDIRDQAAFAAVKALNPTNAADAMLAKSIVAFEAAANDTRRMADETHHDAALAARLRRLAEQLMRQAQSGRNLLRKCQAQPPVPPCPRALPDVRAEQARVARLRALDLRSMETSPTIH
jgi:hypothetical protein